MSNDELLARTEKAEKELAEFKENIKQHALEIFSQELKTLMVARMKEIEEQSKASK